MKNIAVFKILMNDKVFLDTNILVYSYSATDPAKQNIARKLIAKSHSYISTQVLQELANTLTKSSVSCVMIGKYERGEAVPSIKASKKLADILNSTLGYIH